MPNAIREFAFAFFSFTYFFFLRYSNERIKKNENTIVKVKQNLPLIAVSPSHQFLAQSSAITHWHWVKASSFAYNDRCCWWTRMTFAALRIPLRKKSHYRQRDSTIYEHAETWPVPCSCWRFFYRPRQTMMSAASARTVAMAIRSIYSLRNTRSLVVSMIHWGVCCCCCCCSLDQQRRYWKIDFYWGSLCWLTSKAMDAAVEFHSSAFCCSGCRWRKSDRWTVSFCC